MSGDGDVLLGWVRPTLVHGDFMDCVLATVEHDRCGPGRIVGWTRRRCNANISAARNDVVAWFLDESPAQWLMMVDTDMVWPPEAVNRLAEQAYPELVPIVGGLCFAKEPDGRVWPTLYELHDVDDDQRFFRCHSWPDDTLFEVAGTGAAFLLVHRVVFEKVRARQFSAAYPWFQETENRFGRVAEDLTFCLRARDCGFPIRVHTGVRTGHVKNHVVTAVDYRRQVATNGHRP